MISDLYRSQVSLLIQLLPLVAAETCFALKGGTAINMFVNDMPRLSVDIDLTYMPFDNRSEALVKISEALRRIKETIEKYIIGAHSTVIKQQDETEARLGVTLKGTQVKIEVNTVMRGHIMPPRLMKLTEKAESEFGKSAKMLVMSHGELYGGKISAALNRQHPRDLFDIRLMLDKDGITEEIKKGMICALASQARPIHELLAPNLLNQEAAFKTQFQGMTDYEFTYDDFGATRRELLKAIDRVLTPSNREFLISFAKGQPDWEKSGIPYLEEQPAVRWKLENIVKLMKANPDKHQKQLAELIKIL